MGEDGDAVHGEDGRRAGRFYAACMDIPGIESLGKAPLQPLLQTLRFSDDQGHGVGVTEAWDDDTWHGLSEMLGQLAMVDVSPFVSAGVGADDGDSTSNALWLGQSGLTLPSRDYYVGKNVSSDSTLVALVQHISAMLHLYYSDDAANAPEDLNATATAIVELEQVLARHFAPETQLRDPAFYYNVWNISMLEARAPHIRWRVYLGPLLRSGYAYDQRKAVVSGEGSGPSAPTDQSTLFTDTLGSSEAVILEVPAYVLALGGVLEATPRSTVLWYLRWRTLQAFAHHLSAPFRDQAFELSKFVYG